MDRERVLVDIQLNTWMSKTYCNPLFRGIDCEKEKAAVTAALRLLAELLRPYRDAIENPVAVKRVKNWRHYCGAWPRWFRVRFAMTGYNWGLLIEGGEKWAVAAVYKGLGVTIYTDGCLGPEDIIGLVFEGGLEPTAWWEEG